MLEHYIAEHQHDWDMNVQSPTYEHNAWIHRCTKTELLCPVHVRQPSNSFRFEKLIALPFDSHIYATPRQVRVWLSNSMSCPQAGVKKKFHTALRRYKQNYDVHIHWMPQLQKDSRFLSITY